MLISGEYAVPLFYLPKVWIAHARRLKFSATLPLAGFDVDTNAVTLVSSAGVEQVPLQAKSVVAARILDRVEQFLIAIPARNASAKA